MNSTKNSKDKYALTSEDKHPSNSSFLFSDCIAVPKDSEQFDESVLWGIVSKARQNLEEAKIMLSIQPSTKKDTISLRVCANN